MDRVLVTGGAGFIGHHVVEHILDSTDSQVVVIDRLDFSGTLLRLNEIVATNPEWRSRVFFVWHDLRSEINPLVANAIGNVDVILHLAAGSHVDRSIDNPMEFVLDNVVGTCNLLNYARTCRYLRKFLYFSTDEVFGPAPEGVFYKEWDRYRSGNPYSASKAGAEELCVAFENTYKLPITVTHTMNVFGIRQHPEKFIPMVIRKLLLGETVVIHSDPTRTKPGKRHYISSIDVCDAIDVVVNNGKVGEKYNIVGEREMDNLELAQCISEIMGMPLKYELVDFHSSRPGHDLRYALDGSRMKELGWEPQVSVTKRLEDVVKWSLRNKRWVGLNDD